MVCGPDGRLHSGLVLFSVFISYMLVFGMTWSLGVFYVIFLEELTYTSISHVALGTALNTAVVYGIGPLAGMLINMYGPRKVALVGAILSSGGLVATVFSRQVFYMCAVYGVVYGTGLGMCFLSHLTAVYVHFEQWSPLALAAASTGSGVGSLLCPFLVDTLVGWYGWRGALLILGGLTLNLAACALLYGDRSAEDRPRDDVQDAPENRPRDDVQDAPVRQTCNLQIFCDIHYILFCVSNLLAAAGLSVVYVHLGAYAITLGVPSVKAAYLFSTLGALNIIGRLLLGGLTQIPAFTGIRVYIGGIGLAGIATCLLPFASSYVELHVYSAIFGLSLGSWGSPVAKSVSEIVGVTKFTSGFGHLLIFEMIGQLIGAPIICVLYERTGEYSTSFYLTGSVLVAAALVVVVTAIRPGSTEDHTEHTVAGAESVTEVLTDHTLSVSHS